MICSLRTFAQVLVVLSGSSTLLSPSAAAQTAAEAPAVNAATATPLPVAQLNVSPLRYEFDAKASAQTVRLSNPGSNPVVVQVRLFSWVQSPAGEHYIPSSDVTISPAIATIPAGQTQIVRLLRNSITSAGEKRYRLTIDQLPDPKLDRATSAMTRVRFVLPLFMDRDLAEPARLDWSVTDKGLVLTNTGGRTARISTVQMSAAGKPVPLADQALHYVHGGNAITWTLADACRLVGPGISADVDGTTVNAHPAPCR